MGKGIWTFAYATDWNNISPRIGMAWDIFGTGKTVLARRRRNHLSSSPQFANSSIVAA